LLVVWLSIGSAFAAEGNSLLTEAKRLDGASNYAAAILNLRAVLARSSPTDLNSRTLVRAALITDLGRVGNEEEANSQFEALLKDVHQLQKTKSLSAEIMLCLTDLDGTYEITIPPSATYELRTRRSYEAQHYQGLLRWSVFPDPISFNREIAYGRACVAYGKIKEAGEVLERLLARLPTSSPVRGNARLWLSVNQAMQGRPQLLDQVKVEMKASSPILICLAMSGAKIWNGDYAGARRDAEQGLKLIDKKSPRAKIEEAQLLYHLGASYMDGAQTAKAEPYLAKSFALMKAQKQLSGGDEMFFKTVKEDYHSVLITEKKFKEAKALGFDSGPALEKWDFLLTNDEKNALKGYDNAKTKGKK